MDTWDAANLISARLHVLTRRDEITTQLQHPATCGDCAHWMKSRVCHKERNVSGHHRGPSAGTVACSVFEQSCSASRYADKLRQELVHINVLLDGNG